MIEFVCRECGKRETGIYVGKIPREVGDNLFIPFYTPPRKWFTYASDATKIWCSMKCIKVPNPRGTGEEMWKENVPLLPG